jgi:type I restriction enzyme S subunit
LAVVDQGRDFIAGYTNDLGYQFKSDALPVVVFGDHTKAVKYIDFPFAMGADGVKVLKPTTDCEPKYLYHFLRQAKIPDAGYSRHFKFLKELLIPLPSLSEQRRIAATLDKADGLRVKRREAIAKIDQLLQAIFMDAVVDIVRWPTSPLSELCESDAPITYGILQPGPDLEGGVPYVRPSEIKDGSIVLQSLRRTDTAIAARYAKSALRDGDILITIVGTIGAIAVVPKELDGANITQSSARVRISSAKAERRFVELFLRSPIAKRQYDEARLGVAVERLNLHHVRDLQVPIPPLEVQRQVARRAVVVEALKMQFRSSLLNLEVLDATLRGRAFATSIP